MKLICQNPINLLIKQENGTIKNGLIKGDVIDDTKDKIIAGTKDEGKFIQFKDIADITTTIDKEVKKVFKRIYNLNNKSKK